MKRTRNAQGPDSHRVISFAEAKAAYTERYTMEHVPQWSQRTSHDGGTPLDQHPNADKKYYAPQYRTDREWYDNTLFPGEGHVHHREKHCYTTGQTWPLGQWLDKPYRIGQA